MVLYPFLFGVARGNCRIGRVTAAPCAITAEVILLCEILKNPVDKTLLRQYNNRAVKKWPQFAAVLELVDWQA